MGSMPPSVHPAGTSKVQGLLNIGATTTTQTDPREVRASCCWRDITPRDVTTPAATSGVHKTCARRAFSCFVNEGARGVAAPPRPDVGPTALEPPRAAGVGATAGSAAVGVISRSPASAPADDASGPVTAVAAVVAGASTGAADDAASAGPSSGGADSGSAQPCDAGATAAATAPPGAGRSDGARSATPLARQRSTRAALKPAVDKPRSLNNIRSVSTVIRDAIVVRRWKDVVGEGQRNERGSWGGGGKCLPEGQQRTPASSGVDIQKMTSDREQVA